MVSLTPLAQELLAGPNFAVVAAHARDGAIQQTVVWLRAEGDDVVFSSLATRAKLRHLERDPNVTVLVIDRDNGYRFSEIRGTARLRDEGADDLIDELSRAYDGKPWPEERPFKPRKTVVITPTKINDHGSD